MLVIVGQLVAVVKFTAKEEREINDWIAGHWVNYTMSRVFEEAAPQNTHRHTQTQAHTHTGTHPLDLPALSD